MNKTLLTAVSVIAIVAASPVYADMNTGNEKPGTVQQDVKDAWHDTKEAVSDAAEDVKASAKEMYYDAKDAVQGKLDKERLAQVSIDQRTTAQGMIGQPVYNVDGERVAKVHDIIVDRSGRASMVVLADGDFTGLGKLVAFDYSTITTRTAEGDVIASINEKTIDDAASFSYESEGQDADVLVMPSYGYSVSELLDGEIVDEQGRSLASVDNLVFDHGKAEQVIVSFGQKLGIGGEQAALSYFDTELETNDDSIDFRLSQNETKNFEAFKDAVLN